MRSETRPKRKLQLSLRGLFVAVLVVGLGLGAIVRWRCSPIVNRGYHENGNVAWEQWQVQDLHGRYRRLKTVRYYSTGRKSYECGPNDSDKRFWLPDGEPTTDMQAWQRAFASDGEGSIRLIE
jgi:hypothetical protein